jgi:hypothetical protein
MPPLAGQGQELDDATIRTANLPGGDDHLSEFLV